MPWIARELSALEVNRLKHLGDGRNVNFFVGGVTGRWVDEEHGAGRPAAAACAA